MKRLFIALMLCLLLPAGAAAFDLTPYELAQSDPYDLIGGFTPVSPKEYLQILACVMPDGSSVKTLQHWKERQLLLNLALEPLPATGYTPILRADGSIHILQRTDRVENGKTWKEDLTLYTLAGQELTNPRSFEDEPYILRYFGSGFAGVRGSSGEFSELLIYDESEALRFRCTLPFEDAHLQDGFAQDESVYALLTPKVFDTNTLAMCISPDNTVSWTYTDDGKIASCNALHPDGQGGVLLSGSYESDYKTYRFTHLNASGECDWIKTLSAKKAIVHPSLTIIEEDGTITLYGYVVAVSRDLYTLFSMNMDAQGNVLSLDVRDYSMRKDTGPSIFLAGDGTVLVYSHQFVSSPPAVLVPFDDLPRADDPGITLK